MTMKCQAVLVLLYALLPSSDAIEECDQVTVQYSLYDQSYAYFEAGAAHLNGDSAAIRDDFDMWDFANSQFIYKERYFPLRFGQPELPLRFGQPELPDDSRPSRIVFSLTVVTLAGREVTTMEDLRALLTTHGDLSKLDTCSFQIQPAIQTVKFPHIRDSKQSTGVAVIRVYYPKLHVTLELQRTFHFNANHDKKFLSPEHHMFARGIADTIDKKLMRKKDSSETQSEEADDDEESRGETTKDWTDEFRFGKMRVKKKDGEGVEKKKVEKKKEDLGKLHHSPAFACFVTPAGGVTQKQQVNCSWQKFAVDAMWSGIYSYDKQNRRLTVELTAFHEITSALGESWADLNIVAPDKVKKVKKVKQQTVKPLQVMKPEADNSDANGILQSSTFRPSLNGVVEPLVTVNDQRPKKGTGLPVRLGGKMKQHGVPETGNSDVSRLQRSAVFSLAADTDKGKHVARKRTRRPQRVTSNSVSNSVTKAGVTRTEAKTKNGESLKTELKLNNIQEEESVDAGILTFPSSTDNQQKTDQSDVSLGQSVKPNSKTTALKKGGKTQLAKPDSDSHFDSRAGSSTLLQTSTLEEEGAVDNEDEKPVVKPKKSSKRKSVAFAH